MRAAAVDDLRRARRAAPGRVHPAAGPGTSLDTRCYVGDVAAAVLDRPAAAAGQVFNVDDLATDTALDYARRILAAAGCAADVVTVPEAVLPEDMEATKSNAQHFLVDSRKAVSVLGWQRRRPRNGTNWLHPQI